MFSAGHTGAAVMAAHAAFGRLPGVDRPALATTIPTRRSPAVRLDSGATVECRPQHLVQFAIMGSAYARIALGCESPRVGLLSVGEEESKGNELTREAHQLLKAAPVPFVGNVEGREVYSGEADVIVCVLAEEPSTGAPGNLADFAFPAAQRRLVEGRATCVDGERAEAGLGVGVAMHRNRVAAGEELAIGGGDDQAGAGRARLGVGAGLAPRGSPWCRHARGSWFPEERGATGR